MTTLPIRPTTLLHAIAARARPAIRHVVVLSNWPSCPMQHSVELDFPNDPSKLTIVSIPLDSRSLRAADRPTGNTAPGCRHTTRPHQSRYRRSPLRSTRSLPLVFTSSRLQRRRWPTFLMPRSSLGAIVHARPTSIVVTQPHSTSRKFVLHTRVARLSALRVNLPAATPTAVRTKNAHKGCLSGRHLAHHLMHSPRRHSTATLAGSIDTSRCASGYRQLPRALSTSCSASKRSASVASRHLTAQLSHQQGIRAFVARFRGDSSRHTYPHSSAHSCFCVVSPSHFRTSPTDDQNAGPEMSQSSFGNNQRCVFWCL
jgi:hypothetical protein